MKNWSKDNYNKIEREQFTSIVAKLEMPDLFIGYGRHFGLLIFLVFNLRVVKTRRANINGEIKIVSRRLCP